MPYQRKKFYLLLFLALFLSSCIPPNPTNESARLDINEDVLVLSRCRRDGFQSYLAEDDKYCFSHPFGYFQDELSKPDAMMLKSTEDIALLLDPNYVSQQITLMIHHELVKGEDRLVAFVERDPENRSQNKPIPWFLGKEEAWLVKVSQSGFVSYIIYARHGTSFYKLVFSATASLSETSTSATKLEELFFTVAGTFTFLK